MKNVINGSTAKKEIWKELKVEGAINTGQYKISNLGRIKSYAGSKDGKIIKGSKIGGYRTFCVRLENGSRSTRYVHKLVAQTFMKSKRRKNQEFVLHLNHNKLNNQVDNLKWGTKDDVTAHQMKNPVQQRYHKGLVTNSKLTVNKVKIIKKMLQRKNVRKKVIAKQFGITVTQLNRIQKGENWASVKID